MLHVGLYADFSSSGTLIFDFSPHLTECTFRTDEHGFADCRLFAPLAGFDAFWLYQRALVPHLLISDNGVVVWEGRLEDPRVTNKGSAESDGISLAALGYYRSLSDQPHTANYTSVTANTIVAGLLADAPQLSSSTALIGNPGQTLSESYEDKKPSEILDRVVRLGDSNTPPRVWEASVWEKRMLTFQVRGATGRAWYVDISELEVERTLQTLYNSAYGVYYDANNIRAVSSTATDQTSVNRWGLTRKQAVNAQTRASSVASKVRDTIIEDGREPAPRASIAFDALYDAAGARWPLYSARSGDTITIRNLPPMMSVALNRIRTFTILQTDYDAIANTLKVTPESPLATLQEQLSGGPTNAPSSYSSPLSRAYGRIDNLEQEIHGGPGGGGGGGSGGGGSYLVPAGLIALFNGACPGGWTEYTAASGRAIVGLPSGGTLEGTVGSALTDLGTRTISAVVAHLHGVGTLDAAAESSHTHGVGTYNNAAEATHTHGVGSLNAASEAAHTHGVGTYNNATEAAHTHSINPPNTTSDPNSATHIHAVDPPSTSTSGGSAHSHGPGAGGTSGFIIGQAGGALNVGGGGANTADVTPTGSESAHTHTVNIAAFNSGINSVSHVHDIDIASFTSAAGSSHDHAISGSSAAGSSHDHAMSGSVGAGSSHDHAISGSSAAGSSHDHALSGSTASTGSASVDVTMPYIQMRLCQKN